MNKLNELINLTHLDSQFVEKIVSYIDYSETTDSLRKTSISYQYRTVQSLIFLSLNKGKSLFEFFPGGPIQYVIRSGIPTSSLNDYYEKQKVHRGEFLEKLKKELLDADYETIENECKLLLYCNFNRSTKYANEISLTELCEKTIEIISEHDYSMYNLKKCINQFLVSKDLFYLLLGGFLWIYRHNKKMEEIILESQTFKDHQPFINQLKRK